MFALPKAMSILRKRWLALAAGSPVLAACPYPDCGPKAVVPWDGTFVDGGSVNELGYLDFETCDQLCRGTDAGLLPTCVVADAGLVTCSRACVGGRAPPGLES